MARFRCKVGFVESVDATGLGDYKDQVTEKTFRGEILQNYWRNENSDDKLVDDVTIDNRFSIIASPYAYKHIDRIKYIEWSGVKWKITSIEVNYPRLIFQVGGKYDDGDQAETA